jgi:NDP-sugar pyrophosphorylase family protein
MPDIQTVLQNNSTNHKLTEFVKSYYHYGHILDMGNLKRVEPFPTLLSKRSKVSYAACTENICDVKTI